MIMHLIEHGKARSPQRPDIGGERALVESSEPPYGQVTLGFQSWKMPAGFSVQSQTCRIYPVAGIPFHGQTECCTGP